LFRRKCGSNFTLAMRSTSTREPDTAHASRRMSAARVALNLLLPIAIGACGGGGGEVDADAGPQVDASAAGVDPLLDPDRFRAAAKCPACDVLNIARLHLPETRVAAASAKLRTPEDAFLVITLRDSGEVVDEKLLIADERLATKTKYGKLQPDLHAWLAAARPDDRLWVWLWVDAPSSDARREDLLNDEVAAKAHAEKQQKQLDEALLPVREWLTNNAPDAEYGDAGGPMIRVRLLPAQIKQVQELPQVAALGTDAYPGTPHSSPWSTTSQWGPSLRLADAHGVSTGSGSRVCIKEERRTDVSTGIQIVATANASSPYTDSHPRAMAYIVRNTEASAAPWRSVAPSASIYIANWLGYTGSGGVDQWCRDQSAHILSYSYSVATPSGPWGLSATDWAHDWLAKNSPYILVTASGGPKYTYDYVSNRGYNGLVVGGVLDQNTADRSDDQFDTNAAWKNPATAHNDHELPQVVAFTNGVTVSGSEFSGASTATAMVAGVGALLTASDLNGWPEAKRAVILATATGRADQGLLSSLSGAGDRKIGAGVVDAYQAADLGQSSNAVSPSAVTAKGRTAFTATFASSFGADNYLTTKWKAHANSNGRLRVVIAWDATAVCPSGPAGSCSSDTPDADFDLHLYQKTDTTWTTTGTMSCASSTWDSTYEVCDIPVLAGEDYLIGIMKYGTSGSSTYLGVAWYTYQQPSGSPCSLGSECASGTCSAGKCACTSDANCADRFCDSTGQCTTRLALGSGCNRAAQCTSGSCADGVCCDTSCTGTCQACTAAKKGTGATGTCGAIVDGSNPDMECAAQSCSAGVVTNAQVCNGASACRSNGTTSCNGYICSGSGCRTTCSSGSDCLSTHYCAGATCVAKVANGGVCSAPVHCISGNCVDGVCCDTACSGTCQACTAAKKGTGTNGTCGSIADGLNPDGECTPGQSCTAGVVSYASVCNGAGACRSGGTSSCGAYACAGASCAGSCTGDSNCASTHYCSGSTCVAKSAAGVACTAANQCLSGSCADGVCCDTACTGACQACTTAKKGSGADGACGPIADGSDPDVECASRSCSGGLITNAYVCNGSGVCRGAGTTSCDGYGCYDTSNCRSSCVSGADCVSTHFCSSTSTCTPKKVNGIACGGDSECTSAHCVDGVCCDTGCSASCQACNVAGTVGTCTATDETGCAPICGNGWRNEAEECDDGLGTSTSVRRSCSSACKVQDLLAVTSSTDVDKTPSRFIGTGRHPIGVTSTGYATAYVEDAGSTAKIGLATFDSKGVALDPAKLVVGSAPFAANPVVAGLPDGNYAVAYTDFGGDGDALGIALRKINPTTGATGTPTYANGVTNFSQYDADMIWTGTELVVAWVDTSNGSTGPDLRFRRFNSTLAPIAAEETLANTAASEADVALTAFGTGWAAAWRSAFAGMETVYVRAAGKTWTAATTMPGPTQVRPALVQLDATHLLLVYVEHGYDSVAGVVTPAQLRGAIVDTTTSGGSLTSTAIGSSTTSMTTPALARVVSSFGSWFFLAWRNDAISGSPNGDELWLKELPWDPSTAMLDTTATPIALPRWSVHAAGDQRAPGLAAGAVSSGPTLIATWEDYGTSLGVPRTAVVNQLAPLSILRTP